MKIYLVGAHSTGKTTLAKWISETYNLPMIAEVARAVLGEQKLSEIRLDLKLAAEYQSKVLQAQIKAEEIENFVSDRAFDNLAYACQHTLIGGQLIYASRNYFKRFKEAIVFFVRPHKTLVKDDGVRASLTWESIMQIDGMVKLLLEMNDINYISIDTINMVERARIVRSVIHGQVSTDD